MELTKVRTYLGKYVVTQEQYKQVTGDNPKLPFPGGQKASERTKFATRIRRSFP